MVGGGPQELTAEVIETGLCTNCGACQGLCPYWLSNRGRTYKFFSCSRESGQCYAFCPRTLTDMEKLRLEFFDRNDIVQEIGPFRGLYITRAADKDIRANSQHGGTVTALVELAMKEGFLDAAVMTHSGGGLSPTGMLVFRPGDVRQCSGSSFQIPPTLAVLNEALREGKYRKIGVVGTPCKTLAVYKMKKMFLDGNDRRADSIGIVFGLFCGWGIGWEGLEKLVKTKICSEKLKRIDIPPSKYQIMELCTGDGRIEIPLDEVYPIVRDSCRYCIDMTAEFSDLSVGGARSSAGWDFDRGWNQVIVRSKKGEELLKIAIKKGVLEYREIEPEDLEKLRKASVNKKKNAIRKIIKKTGNLNNLLYLDPDDPLLQSLLLEAKQEGAS